MMICTRLLGWLVLSFRLILKVKALLTGFRGLGVHKSVLITNVTVKICQKIASLSMYITLPAIDFYRVMKKCLSNLSLQAI